MQFRQMCVKNSQTYILGRIRLYLYILYEHNKKYKGLAKRKKDKVENGLWYETQTDAWSESRILL